MTVTLEPAVSDFFYPAGAGSLCATIALLLEQAGSQAGLAELGRPGRFKGPGGRLYGAWMMLEI
jgi:hypothetical protein